MKVEYVSIKSAVLDWIEDNGLVHEEVNEPLLIRWAADCVRWCSTTEQLKHRVGVFQVVDSRVHLPDDFEVLIQAASNQFYEKSCDCERSPEDPCCKDKYQPKNGRMPKTRREDIVQWVQGTMEKDCHLEINLNCPRCKTTSCSCDDPIVEVDVDRIWEMAHPEIYFSHFTRIGRFGDGPGQNSPYASVYSPKFHLMKYATNDFHKLKELVGGCPNVDCRNCHREFILDKPYLEVDFDRGEVLLSYLGKALDEDGEIMIPDHPDVHEAIGHHLDFKWYRLKWKRDKDNADRITSTEAAQYRDNHIGNARAALDIPSANEVKSFLENSTFLKRIARWSSDYMNKEVPNISDKYGDALNKGYHYNRR